MWHFKVENACSIFVGAGEEMSRLVPKHKTCLAQLVGYFIAGILFHMVGSLVFLPPVLTGLADRHIVLPPSSGHT